MNTVDILKNTLLFNKMDDKQLTELISHIEEISYPANKTFIKEGDLADSLYIIKKGSLQIYTWDSNHQEIVLARLETGDFVGEQALLSSMPGRRNANVRTLTEVTLLKIKHTDFLRIIESDEELKNELKKAGVKQLITNLKAKEPNLDLFTARGEMTLYMDQFMHMPAVICKFDVKDGRQILSTYVVGKNIRAIREANSENAISVSFESKAVYRELLFMQERLVGVVAYGEWSALRELYSRVFDKKSVSAEEMKNFKQHGEVTFQGTVTEENDEEIICNCIYLTKREINDCIKQGCTSVDEIGIAIGAGTVCGSCIPTLQSMLGHQSWMAMHILDIKQLTPDVRSYRLGPIYNKPLKSFTAGQHVVIQCEIDGNWIERSYTLVSAPKNSAYYEIAIKREDQGLLSRWIFENAEIVPFLRVSHPTGNLAFNSTQTTPLICFTAGIGITPAVGLARAIVDGHTQRPVIIYTSARNKDYLAYDEELNALAGQYQQIQYIARHTQEKGRLKAEDVVAIAQNNPHADFFICGPKGFETMVKTALQSAAIPESRIIIEQFTHAGGPQ